MIRRVIQIDEDKCNGCGACANACHEGAIGSETIIVMDLATACRRVLQEP